mmetsp:Transcript_14428/g.10161  ORF Transcript_14428/g.10161 Transcript_14428/m.10161 type:complete len:140 (-) Transcript_14428:378-797(-)
MSGLSNLKSLTILNLSANYLTSVDGIEGLPNLKTLDLNHNLIEDITLCKEIHTLPELTFLDLSSNQINQKEEVLEFFSEMQTLLILNFRHNPIMKTITGFRKTLCSSMAKLAYLDDRPISDTERLFAKAWKKGGKQLEE